MGKLIAIISFAIFLGAFVFCAVGYGAPWWIMDKSDTVSYGLFQVCLKLQDKWECEKYPTDIWTSAHKATLATMTIGLALNLGAMGLYCKALCGDKSLKAAAGDSIGVGVTILIAVIIYGAQDRMDVDYLGWAFWVTAVGGAGHVANGIVTLVLDCISCC